MPRRSPDALRITVLTSCTGAKSNAAAPLPAERLYRGQQHLRLMAGVDAARAGGHAVTVAIVSAGHGLVDGATPLLPYERTFQGMTGAARRRHADALGLSVAVCELLAAPADVTLVLLGRDYLDAVALPADVELSAPTLALCGRSAVSALPRCERLRPLVLDPVRDARRFACGLVGLKGEVAGRLLTALATQRPQERVDRLASDELLAAAPPARLGQMPRRPATAPTPARSAAAASARSRRPSTAAR